MDIEEKHKHSVTPGLTTYNRSYYTSGSWKSESSVTDDGLGSKFVHGWKSAYNKSDRIKPTAFQHISVEATGSRKYHYYRAFYKETIMYNRDWATLICSCNGSTVYNDVNVPFMWGTYQTSSSAVVPRTVRPTFRRAALQDDIDAADNVFLDEINNNSQDIGAFLVELGETVSYVAAHSVALCGFAKAIVTGRYNEALKKFSISRRAWARRGKKLADDIPARWLEWNFAIKPLVADMQKFAYTYSDPVSALGHLSYKTSKTVKVSGSAKGSIRMTTNSWKPNVVVNNWDGFIRTSVVWKVHDMEVLSRNALGIHAKAPALWEGVPFSWLVDYIVNIGDFLAALSATDGLTFVHGHRAIKLKQQTTMSINVPESVYYLYDRYEVSATTTGYDREVLTDFPKPHLRFVLPEIKLRQVSYALALAAILAKSKRRQ